MLKKLLIIIFGLPIIFLACFWIFANLFLRITEQEAHDIALQVIQEEYATICGGEFEKYLEQKKGDIAWGDYIFFSDNKRCLIYIYVYPIGGAHESGLMPND